MRGVGNGLIDRTGQLSALEMLSVDGQSTFGAAHFVKDHHSRDLQPVYKSPVHVKLDEDLRGKQERFEMAPSLKKRGSNGPNKERI